MRNPLQLTEKMLEAIENRAKQINNKLPENINFTPFILMNIEKNQILLLLTTGYDMKANNYLNHSKPEIKKLIKDATGLNWSINANDVFVLESGYVVFSDDEGIEEYHKIEGCEYHFEAIYLNGKETTRNAVAGDWETDEEGWEMDINEFDFERENPYKKGKELYSLTIKESQNVNTG